MRFLVCLLAMAMITSAAPRIQVQGHRGARTVLPENTLPGFVYAIEAGADVLELDLAVTRDNVLVVSHDPVMNLSLCSGPEGNRVIREMTLAELRRWDCGSKQAPGFPRQKPAPGAGVPTLDEVLALSSRGGFFFNIEAKISADKPQYTPPPEEFARLVAGAVRRHKLERRVYFQSFDFRILNAMKKIAPELPLAALWSSDPREFAQVAREASAQVASPQYKLVTPEKVRAAHAAGLTVTPWTANEPEVWNQLIAAGVDSIITDDPAGLIAHLKARGMR